MLDVVACITEQHDHRLVILAGLICALSTWLAAAVIRRAAGARRVARRGWVSLAAVVTGLGVWATHFIAMIAYEPKLPIGYDLTPTLLSIAIAVLLAGMGWRIELGTRRRSWSPLSALAMAAGIGAMHFTGMSALKLPGHVIWNGVLVAASLAIGAAFCYVASLARRRMRRRRTAPTAIALCGAICGLHFTAMAAASIQPDPRIAIPVESLDKNVLGVLVGLAALILLAACAVYIWLDHQLSSDRAAERQRMRDFANAAREGIVLVEGGRVTDVNAAFARLAGWQRGDSRRLAELLPALDDATSLALLAETERPHETLLHGCDGETIDVEVAARQISWRGVARTVLAVTDIRERKAAEKHIRYLAYHDPLTGVANRMLFNEALEHAIEMRERRGGTLAVFCLDLDRFKAINDAYGHAVGDELLRHVSQQLRKCAGDGVTVARLGGDEFALMARIEDIGGDAGSLARRLLAHINRPLTIGGQTMHAAASIGIAMVTDEATDAATALRNADLALYRAKADGRGGFRFFEPAMDAGARERAAMEADLRSAIRRGELSIDYQPLVGLETGRVEGFEALVRWVHPERGLIMPGDFIPIAEDSGLIVELGDWVLRKACADAASWRPALRLSVNLSPAQFAYSDLFTTVDAALAEAGLPADRLELEVTEGVFIADPARAVDILQRIRALGVQIVMDDFGTGYSSLSYFRHFPFDKVKIDRSFVADMLHNKHARSIVEAVISLGRGLELKIVAEGVESEEQLRQLQLQGCTQAQGFFISPARPIEEFAGSVLLGANAADAEARSIA